MKKFTSVQIAVAVGILVLLVWWSMRKATQKPGDGVVIVTPMPVSNYSVDHDIFDDDGVPSALPANVIVTTPKPKSREGYAMYDPTVDKDWALHPEEGYDEYPSDVPPMTQEEGYAEYPNEAPPLTEEGYDDYAPTNFKSELLD